MNAPERVLKAVNHEEPDRVPAFESAFTNNTIMKNYGVKAKGVKFKSIPDSLLRKGSESRKIQKVVLKKGYEFSRRAGLDLVVSVCSLFPRTMLKDGKKRYMVDEYGRMMQSEFYPKDKTMILGYVGGYFKSFEDYESWEQPDPHWKARLTGFEVGRELQKEMNDDIFSIPSTGSLMEVSWEGFGLELFSRILSRPKQAKRVFDDRGEFTLELVKILTENDAQIVLLWDDWGFKNGLFMSPRNYRKYIFPWLTRICDAAHKLDCKIMLHSDGDLIEIFEDIIKAGVDVLNPIESTTANPDYDIFKLNERFGDKITFSGNLSPMLLTMGTIAEIEENAKRLIRELAPGGGYIFGSGHSVSPSVSIDRFEAMQNIKRKYGNYPINVPD